MLERILSRLTLLDADEYLFITDGNGAQVREFMDASSPTLQCRYIVQQERQGLALAAPLIEEGDDLLIVFNDTIFDADLTAIRLLSADCYGLIYSKEVEDYQRFGVNVARDGLIVGMAEQPETLVSKLAQVGLYYLKDGDAFMKHLQRTIECGETVKGEFYLPAVFMRMIRDGSRFKAPEIDVWLDCGTPETLLSTNSHLLAGRHHNHGEAVDSVLIEPVHIEKGAVVRRSILGPNVSVAAGSVVEACIPKNMIINADSHVSNMVLHDSILRDCVQLAGSTGRMNIGDHSLIEMHG